MALIAVSLMLALLLTRGLVKAGQNKPPSMLVVSLSLLSMSALLGGLAFDSDSALALAGAGMGALAGAVSSTFTQGQRPCAEEEEGEEGKAEDDAITE